MTNLHLYHLERIHFMHLQYGRRDSQEIVGISQDVKDERLEEEVIEILKEAEVWMNRQSS